MPPEDRVKPKDPYTTYGPVASLIRYEAAKPTVMMPQQVWATSYRKMDTYFTVKQKTF